MTTGESKQSLLSDQRRSDSPPSVLPPQLSGPEFLFNRELSLLEFHRRVLEEALDDSQPLLERLKFLSIFSTNTDEFFMIRVSGLKEALEEDVTELSPDGMTITEQLKATRERLLPMLDEQMRCLRDDILPGLLSKGIEIVSYYSLSESERRALDDYFTEDVFPVLTPQAVDSAHPFPYISGLSLNIGLMVEPIPEHGITQSLTGTVESRFARIKVPPLVPRLVQVGKTGARFALLEEVIAANAHVLFSRMHVSHGHFFRVTRDADIEVREDKAADLLKAIEQTLRKRRFGSAVRLEVSKGMPDAMVRYLTKELELTADDVYVVDGPLRVNDLMELNDLDRPDLKDKPLKIMIPRFIKNEDSIFEVIKKRDVLLHHPYTSYSTVVKFIEAAAQDPDVLAIKMCLYRTGADSPIPQSLIEACEQGKQVTAIVEIKARFDEEHNIEWAKRLEEAGVHVVYGVVGLKVHCKVALVVRREDDDDLRRYVHIATGNYNPVTSNFYTDLGILTASEEIGADASDLFNFLTGYSRQKKYRQLLVAPVNLRERMISLIRRETEHARAGRPARISVKINRLADIEVIRALYEASQAGVPIDLIVRGVCMLRPGVPGLSETITVRSIVGRLLEHSRAYYFANGGDEELYTGSADWMSRNFDRRVEVIAPVYDPNLKKYLKDVVLATYLKDNVKARLLLPDGSYERIKAAPGEERVDAQMYFQDTIGTGLSSF
ncbi:MAG: polyphosphate kinase [Acidobacteriota bacterium]|jgi:polyphosphate kinase|nr:polyphosphate kinase [Acidobacteriota bacterium]